MAVANSGVYAVSARSPSDPLVPSITNEELAAPKLPTSRQMKRTSKMTLDVKLLAQIPTANSKAFRAASGKEPSYEIVKAIFVPRIITGLPARRETVRNL